MPKYPVNYKFLLLLLITAVLGFALKYYRGPAQALLNNSLAGIAYVVFWCLLFKLIIPKTTAFKIVSLVTLITCLLEFAQLWHPTWLNSLRSGWLGKTLLGTTFNWTDLPFYLLGGFIAWLLIRSPLLDMH